MDELPPAVRILPMDRKNYEFLGKNSLEVQEQYFLNKLARKPVYYYGSRSLNALPGTVILFQFNSKIIATAVLREILKFTSESKPPLGEEDSTGAFRLDAGSIRVFEPVDAEVLAEVWRGEFKRFSQAKQKLDRHYYPLFVQRLRAVRVPHSLNADPDFAESGAVFGQPAANREVEEAAINKISQSYKDDGWSVESVENQKLGFDLRCRKGASAEDVEVKGVRGTDPSFLITAGEVRQANENVNFVLYVVTSALSSAPGLYRYRGCEFVEKFDLSGVQYLAKLKR